jgi:hypothetical protein
VLAHFAEYGAWDREAVERHTLRPIEQAQPARWGQYHPVAVDDTELHRTSKQVWGTCTFHESSARSPNRAETARAYHWVEMGDLLPAGRGPTCPMARGCTVGKANCPWGRPSAPRRLWRWSCCGRPMPSRPR